MFFTDLIRNPDLGGGGGGGGVREYRSSNSLPNEFPLPIQIILGRNFFGTVTHYRGPNNSPKQKNRSVIILAAMVMLLYGGSKNCFSQLKFL